MAGSCHGALTCWQRSCQNTEMLRSDFVNSFSHEFKTPIVSIQGFAQLLSRGGLSEKQTREYLEIIEEESRRLAAMATNALNYSKIENQKILTGISRFNLSEQIRTCISPAGKEMVQKRTGAGLWDFRSMKSRPMRKC